jgi:hypothetical protein
MNFNIRIHLLLTVLVCICCAGNAYALIPTNTPVDPPYVMAALSFNPGPPFYEGEHVVVTASLTLTSTIPLEIQGVAMKIASENRLIDGEGFTDEHGRYTFETTIPIGAYNSAKSGGFPGSLAVYAVGTYNGLSGLKTTDSFDYYCKIVPNPNIPEFPSVAVPVAAILGLVVIFGHKKNMV